MKLYKSRNAEIINYYYITYHRKRDDRKLTQRNKR